MKTEAIVFNDKNKVTLETVTLPEISDDEVLVDVEYSCISPGTERSCLMGRFYYGEQQNYSFPFVPGYQHAGRVKAVGRAVSSLQPGDRVFAQFSRFENRASKWGGHCSMSLNKEYDVVKLPDGVQTMDASALVILQVGYNGGSRPPVEPGNIAVVFGDGLIGQFVSQTLRSRGAYVVIVGRGNEKRMALARKYSCDKVISMVHQDYIEEIKKMAPNGVKIVVEAVGTSENFKPAFDLLAHNGHFVLNGFYPQQNRVDLNPFSIKEITIYNPASIQRDRLEKTISWLAQGKLDVRNLITHVVKVTEAPNAFHDLILNRKEFSLGVIIDWKEAK
jgi:2-desacetyl-2-hydroxyethyl bacteriochlorophyllide A dehydrogenase